MVGKHDVDVDADADAESLWDCEQLLGNGSRNF
jgi:hypothetical protein